MVLQYEYVPWPLRGDEEDHLEALVLKKNRVCENKDFDFFFIFRGEKKGGAFAVNDAWWVGRRKKGEEGRAEGETLSKLGESSTAPSSLPQGGYVPNFTPYTPLDISLQNVF